MRVLFVIETGHGHLYPILPVARAAETAGHVVAIAVPAPGADLVRSSGHDAYALSAAGWSDRTDRYKRDQASRPAVERGRAALDRYLTNAVALVPALRDVVRTFRPDVVVRETTALAGWLVGETEGIPTAVFDFAPTSLRLLALTAGDLFDRARRRVGLPPDPQLATLHGVLHIVSGPPAWYPPHTLASHSRLFRPGVLPGDPEPELLRWLERRPAGRSAVYVTMGTVFNTDTQVFRVVLEALQDEHVDVLVTVGPGAAAGALLAPSETVRIEGFVPQAGVLAHVDAVVSHGGYGTVMGALGRGLPVVCLPSAASDVAFNAARLEALGAGVVLDDGHRTVHDVRAAVRLVLQDGSYRAAALRSAQSMRRLPSVAELMELLQRRAGSGARVGP